MLKNVFSGAYPAERVAYEVGEGVGSSMRSGSGGFCSTVFLVNLRTVDLCGVMGVRCR